MEKKQGRTLFDFLSENKWFSIPLGVILLLILIVIFCYLVAGGFQKVKKVGPIELDSYPESTVQRKTDTVFLEKTDTGFITKDKKPKYNRSEKKEGAFKMENTNKGDSQIVLHNPKNTVIGTNNGIVGDNNNIYTAEKPILTDTYKISLVNLVDEAIELDTLHNKINTLIYISKNMTNSKAIKLAEEISIFLITEGYRVDKEQGILWAGETNLVKVDSIVNGELQIKVY